VKFKRLSSKFIDPRIQGNKAMVVFQTPNRNTENKVNQKAVFYSDKRRRHLEN